MTDDTTGRTRLEAPSWCFGTTGTFQLDLSWNDDSRRWLEVQPDPHPQHPSRWRLLIREAADDSSWARSEVLLDDIEDPTALMASIEADPASYDRSPA